MKKKISKKILVITSFLLFLPLFVGCFGAPSTNHAPTIISTPITTATVDVLYTYDVEATDPDDDTLTYSLTTSPSGMAINPSTGVIDWTPTLSQIGDNNVTVRVSDGLLNDSQDFIITVDEHPGYTPPTNHAPTIISTPITTATESVPYTYHVNATDIDGDTLIYSLATNPSGMAINPSTGVIDWTPNLSQIGDNNVTVRVSDGKLFDTQSFVITVNPSCGADKPTVVTNDVSNIGETTVTANGNITNTGGENCTVRGFQYGLTQTPTWDVHSSGSFGTGSYNMNLSGLICETTYYVRAYATNCAGTSYGEWKSFTTAVCPIFPPTVVTNDVSNIGETTVTANGNITNTGGENCTVRGFQYGLTQTPTWDVHSSGSFGTGSYNMNLPGLTLCTKYYVRAYATNSAGTSYGVWKSFTTTGCPITPNLKLTPATQSVTVGNQGTVDVVVEDVTALMAASITLNFDATKLQYVSSAPGSFFSNAFIVGVIPGSGSVTIDMLTLEEAPSGTGTIMTVIFERIDTGTTNITFGATQLNNDLGDPITHTKGGGCSITDS